MKADPLRSINVKKKKKSHRIWADGKAKLDVSRKSQITVRKVIVM